MPTPRISLALALALVVAAAGPAAGGGSVPALLQVIAEVRPSVVLRFELRRSDISITAADIERGYVDLPASSLISVAAGGQRPEVVLDFAPGGPFKSVQLRAAESSPGDAASAQPGELKTLEALAPRGAFVAAISYRLNLAAEVSPGAYALPVLLNIEL